MTLYIAYAGDRTRTHCRCYHRNPECQRWSEQFGHRPLQVLGEKRVKASLWRDNKRHVPTLTGLILIPSSVCAVSGLSQTLCCKTSDSQRVFTNVVRPVPEAPKQRG